MWGKVKGQGLGVEDLRAGRLLQWGALRSPRLTAQLPVRVSPVSARSSGKNNFPCGQTRLLQHVNDAR